MAKPMEKHIIVGVHITERLQHALDVQKVLSEYGCNIKARLGLHEVSGDFCASTGVLILEMVGDEKLINEMTDKLNAITGIEVKTIIFDHP